MNTLPLKILFVCAMDKRRSVTAERLYRNDARLQVRSAGIRAEAKRRTSESDVKWPDAIFVMERQHKRRILAQFRNLPLPALHVLDVPDNFEVIDPELQLILRSLLDAEIGRLVDSDSEAKAGQ